VEDSKRGGMISKMKLLLVATALISVITALWLRPSTPQQGVIIINANITYQTIVGWEATSQAGQTQHRAKWLTYRDALYDQAVNDLGINRIRLEIKANASGFEWAAFDQQFADVILPLRQKLAARGESLWVNVCVVEGALATNPHLYAQQVLATYQRMQRTYGFIPDSWEAGLEPDTFDWGIGRNMGNCIVAAGQLLAANGYPSKVFVAPSSSNIRHAAGYFDEIVTLTPAAAQYLMEVSYHIYGGASNVERLAIFSRAFPRGLKTMQGERIGATYDDLHQDLKVAQVSSWQQYTLCWMMSETGDNGGQYYVADDVKNPTNPPLLMGSRTRFLRQYFKFIRRGAVRIDAASTNPNLDPVAFRNTDGRQVVVVKATSAGSFIVQGLSVGTYGIKYTTSAAYDVNAPVVSIGAGQTVSASIPAAGVITIYGTTTTANPTPTPTPTLRNIAIARQAIQSSTALGGEASHAVDNNTDGSLSAGSVTLTNLEKEPWWQLDLGAVNAIEKINVWNRTDCCSDRLRNFYVLVSDAPMQSVDLTSTRNHPEVSSYYMQDQAGRPTTITVNRPGRYIRVQLADTNILALAEIEVWGRGLSTTASSSITVSSAALSSVRVCAPESLARVTDGLGSEEIPLVYGLLDKQTGKLPAKLGGVQVLVNNVAAEILDVVNQPGVTGRSQVDFVVPAATPINDTVPLCVTRDDVNGNALTLGEMGLLILTTAPSLWTLDKLNYDLVASHNALTLLADEDTNTSGYDVVETSVLNNGNPTRNNLRYRIAGRG
jgi:F5/8 type C domain-containing protein/glycosyl hydrolase family 30